MGPSITYVPTTLLDDIVCERPKKYMLFNQKIAVGLIKFGEHLYKCHAIKFSFKYKNIKIQRIKSKHK